MIDRMPSGIVLLDSTGRVVFVNRAAKQVFDSRDGLILRRNTVFAASTQQTAELHHAIAETLAAVRGEGLATTAGGALSISRPSLKRPLHVLVAPIRNRQQGLGFGAAAATAALFVSDPDTGPVTSSVMLQKLYGLTLAEARLAHELATGVNLEEAASRLGVRLETVRARLKVIFKKTDTHRQADLVRLLLSTPDLLAGG